MKTPPLPDEDEDGIPTRSMDWKEGPDSVLEKIDELLEAHGLEVVNYDTDADFYCFGIAKRG